MKKTNTPNNVTPLPTSARRILEPFEIEQIIAERVAELNQIYTHVVSKGKNYVVRVGTNSLDRLYLEFFTVQGFRETLLHHPDVLVGYTKQFEPKTKTIAEVWLRHPAANVCDKGVTFHPIAERYYKGMLNAYFGLGVEPIECHAADLEFYLTHVFEVICNSDKDCYEYLISWLAHMIQKPWEKPEVAIILKAGQGTGKGTFVDPIGRIIGAHYLHATKPDHIVGRFNSMLENMVLIFADEFFAGSKKNTDQLKGMITEKTASIERKGIDSIVVPSFSRLIMASNHDNIVIIEKDERRYLYLEVSEKHKQNHEYFEDLHKVINAPEFAGKLLKFLLDRDITTFNPRKIPKTKALTEQKLDSLEPLEKWVYGVLTNGTLTGGQWPARESSQTIVDAVEKWLDDHRLTVWGDLPRKLGHLLTKLGFIRFRKRINENREYFYDVPKLEDAQKAFCDLINGDIEF